MIYNEKAVYVCKALIRRGHIISAFPEDGHSFTLKLYAKFLLIKLFFSIPLVFGMINHLYQSVMKGHTFEAVSVIYLINFAVMYYSACTVFFLRGTEVLTFLDSLSKMKEEGLSNYEKTAQFVEKLTNILYYSCILVLIGQTLESYFRENFCNNKELLNDPHYVCGTMIPLWFPLEENYPLLKPVCALYSTGLILAQVPTMASAASLYLGSVEFILLKIRKFTEKLKEIDFEKANKEVVEKKIRACIVYYQEICSLVKEMNDSIGYVFAPTHNAYNNLMMGICAYLALKIGSITNGFQLVVWIFVQWMSCYSGQRLENASLSLREDIFGLTWHHMDPSMRSTFKIFQAHVDLTLHLKVQPIMYMNMNNFSTILKGTYSFLMYLLKI